MNLRFDRAILIVLDSVGIGGALDAARFGDEGANTLRHIGEWCRAERVPFSLPELSRWGLGHLVETYGLAPSPSPIASFGVLEEISSGKDTMTGHWEIAGIILDEPFPIFPQGFAEPLLRVWCAENDLPGYLGNRPASGTEILDDLGEEHLSTGKPIVYTSADSVLQVAASETTFGLERLYKICRSARELSEGIGVGRVIARPFVGSRKGEFKRTANRRDYSLSPPEPHLLDLLRRNDRRVYGVGKIEDIFAGRSIDVVEHTSSNAEGIRTTLELIRTTRREKGLIFTNLVDFDTLYGHRRDPRGYAEALVELDGALPKLAAELGERDILILTADHGNDPTWRGTDHTRENVPLLCYSPHPRFVPERLGTLRGFTHVANLVLEALDLSCVRAQLPACRNATLSDVSRVTT